MDRISGLPQPVLHHILSFLVSNKDVQTSVLKKAVQTSVLSKSWRHLWSTHPKFILDEENFFQQEEREEDFSRVLDATLRGYLDRNLCLDKFDVRMFSINVSASILRKWIPVVIHNMRVHKFVLHYDNSLWPNTEYFDLPWAVFESQHLRYLYLHRCNLSKLDSSIHSLCMKSLKRIVFKKVRTTDECLEKIISGCPSLKYLYMKNCKELRNVRVINTSSSLKSFTFELNKLEGNTNSSIEIDAPSTENISITIVGCRNWYLQQNQFPHLKSLYLQNVRLSAKSFDSFSTNFPSIENLRLLSCYGFKRFQISSASIKSLLLWHMSEEVKMVAIDAPNIVNFSYDHRRLPWSFSFTTISGDWSSSISFNIDQDRTWLLKLNEVLKALSRSKISLHVCGKDPRGISGCKFYEPVVLEKLWLNVSCGQSPSSLSDLLDGLFGISRPREICDFHYFEEASGRESNQLIEILCKTLLVEEGEREMTEWKRHLEEAILEASDSNKKVGWRCVDAPSWLEPRAVLLQNKCGMRGYDKLRFRLTWRERES